MEWLNYFFQDLPKYPDGWSGWKVYLVGLVVASLFSLFKIFKKWRDNKKEDNMNMSKSEKQNDCLAYSIKEIEYLHAHARDKQAYEKFCQICSDYPYYKSQASAILARFIDFQDQCIRGTLQAPQRSAIKNEIRDDFQSCLQQFKQEISDK